MNDFEKLCFDTSVELGRALNEKEVDFLRWVHKRHLEELREKGELQMGNNK